ncbi:MAG: hypothetical protein DLM59_09040 [Pseudonocardiales bacterium]|nr:MAG: hypothetical protein DLM59_09040 [Pseudonocardiales bacterium]
MPAVGAELADLVRLSKDFTTNGHAAADIKKAIDTSLGSTHWTGPAADKFRSEWNQFSPTLIKIQHALTEASTAVSKRRDVIDAATS